MQYDPSNTLDDIWHQIKNQYQFRSRSYVSLSFKMVLLSRIIYLECKIRDKHVGSWIRNCKVNWVNEAFHFFVFWINFFRYFHPNLTTSDVQLFLPNPRRFIKLLTNKCAHFVDQCNATLAVDCSPVASLIFTYNLLILFIISKIINITYQMWLEAIRVSISHMSSFQVGTESLLIFFHLFSFTLRL